ncbi:MAG: malate/lactate/ureidoglycolate dehydrogenase [Rhodospirillales bacterium]
MICIEAAALRRVISGIFNRAGSSETEAEIVARRLVEANLAGHDSHGVVRIPSYMELIRTGGVTLNAHAKVVHDTPVLAVVDGQVGFGQVIGGEAMEIGIAKAKKHGLAMIALRHSGHLGRIGDWTELCCEAGLASIHFVNVVGAISIVAPFGGTDARTSTNPVSAGMPRADGRHIAFDAATSKLAEGKVKVAFNKGVALPEGALLDNKGKPTREPGDLYTTPRGALTPMGEHKGYGLAVMCELLAGLVSGGGSHHPATIGKGSIRNNMLSFIFDPLPGGDANWARDDMQAFIDWITASPPAEPGKKVMLPGDPERANRAERMKNGVKLDDTTWANIVKAAAELGMDRTSVEKAAKKAA